MRTSRSVPLAFALLIGALAPAAPAAPSSLPKKGTIRLLFLGHEGEHDNSNLFWRQTAQRLLVDDGERGAVDGLKSKVGAGGAGAGEGGGLRASLGERPFLFVGEVSPR